MAETWTVGRLLTWTTNYLQQQGADSPRLDAEVLLAEARGCKRIELYTAFDQPAAEDVRQAFRELVRRRAEGMPVAYLVGRREFYSLNFRVTPDVLIPRPETELLVIRLLDLAKGLNAGEVTVADVGTGSGAITVSAAKHLPAARFAAIDVSPAALEVAKLNAADHQVADRIDWYESDLFAAVPPDRTFDFVVSNPPYITSAEMAELPATVRDFEPRLALEAGPRGTEVIERLVAEAGERLHPGGWLLVEISPMLGEASQEVLRADGRFDQVSTLKDLAGHVRIVQGQRKAD